MSAMHICYCRLTAAAAYKSHPKGLVVDMCGVQLGCKKSRACAVASLAVIDSNVI
jgi:hypothetical protein